MLERAGDHWAETLQHKAEAYALNAFGVALSLETLSTASLPFYIFDRYRLWRGELLRRPCIFMAPQPDGAADGPAEIDRHREVVRKHWPADTVILLLEALGPRRRQRFVAERIAFMAPGAQLYVPEWLLEFRDGRFPKPSRLEAPEQFSPTAQMVVVAALLGRPVEGANVTALAHTLGVAAMSVVRAFDELQAAGVAEARRAGRERTLHLVLRGRDLWDEMEPRLQSPVRKVRRVHIPDPERFPGVIAGESALANYTALAAPRIQVQAVAASVWNWVVKEHGLIVDADGLDVEEIQTWTYDPQVFGEHMTVDRLSLYLSLRGLRDERVAQAREQLLEDMAW